MTFEQWDYAQDLWATAFANERYTQYNTMTWWREYFRGARLFAEKYECPKNKEV